MIRLLSFALVTLAAAACAQSQSVSTPALPLAGGQPTFIFFYTDN